MFAWLQELDCTAFRLINKSFTNPLFDWLMPRLASPRLFPPFLLAGAVFLLWKGGRRGRLFVLCLTLAIALADGFASNTIKKAVGRERPGLALPDTICRLPSTMGGSMPSAHATNWFAATMVAFVFYRRSWRFMLPAAILVSFSRVYDGVHYPSDVLAGAILGAGSAAATLWLAEMVWRSLGRKWFPIWWEMCPSVCPQTTDHGPEDRGQRTEDSGPSGGPTPSTLDTRHPDHRPRTTDHGPLTTDDEKEDIRRRHRIRNTQYATRLASHVSRSALEDHWLRLGYLLIAALLAFRLAYIASGTIELTHDEAYQWLWSKHLALSYYSKPPGIALIQFAGTSIWGDTEFGVRFFAPVFAAILSLVVVRFMAREVGARQGFILLLVLTAAPLMGLGTILLTIDAPLVLCWTLAMLAGWRALHPDGNTRHWLLTGLAAGLAFLSKYSALYLVPCFALFFLLWKPARIHLKRPGPWLALLSLALSTLPVVIWNSQHNWITVHHVADNAAIAHKWQPTPRFFTEFIGIETALLNPVFFIGSIWAMIAFWKTQRPHDHGTTGHMSFTTGREAPPGGPVVSGQWSRGPAFALSLFFFCMGAPVFVGHLLYTLHSRVQPNWIAPAVVPMFCLMVLYWDRFTARRYVTRWFAGGLALGLTVVVLLHEPRLFSRIAGQPLPGEMDPLRRALGWKETAAVVEQAWQKLLGTGVPPAFIIADHYGMAGEITFYLPSARVGVKEAGGTESLGLPLVYCLTPSEPNNQLYFWPDYRYVSHRAGENAIYVAELGPFPLEKDWPLKWLKGEPIGYSSPPQTIAIPPQLLREFDSVTDLGMTEVKLGQRVLRRLQLFECRNLRGKG